ncbi:MAG: single-stranded DNA-binding protein [Lachnospirales bacterium]
MNKVILMGRLVRDPEVRYSQSATPMAIARYSLAVNRKIKGDGEPNADFINCVAFGKTGEFVEKYLKKGMLMSVVGTLKTGSYDDKDGKKVYTTDVVVEEHFFGESKKESHNESHNDSSNKSTFNSSQNTDDDLPF